MRSNRIFVVILVIVIAAIGSYIFLARGSSDWGNLQQASCLQSDGDNDVCFCEATHEEGPGNPVYAWTSLPWVILGIGFLINALRSPSFVFWGSIFGSIVLWQGLAAVFNHSSLTLIGQTLDNSAVYMLVLFPWALYSTHIWKLPRQMAVILYVVANALVLFTLIIDPTLSILIFHIAVFAYLFLEWMVQRYSRGHRSYKYLIWGLVIFVIGGITSWLDLLRVWCNPDSVWQGHGLWHITSLIAAWFLYMHYKNQVVD